MEKLIQVVMIGLFGWLVYFTCTAIGQKKMASMVGAATLLICAALGISMLRNVIEAITNWFDRITSWWPL
jgi:uncharacterized membrane protein YjjB (DUF3815 family)